MKNGTEVKYYSGSKKFKKSETSYKGGKKHGKKRTSYHLNEYRS